MRFNLCHSCVYFAPEVKDGSQVTRKHCLCPQMEEVFGIKHGFPVGIDIINCDFFRLPRHYTADVTYSFPSGKMVSYIIPSVRPKTRSGAGSLSDNSKNVKVFKMM